MAEISVVIPCYNAQEDLPIAVESVLSQTAIKKVSEIVVIDDGSTDNTNNVALRLSRKYEKVKCITQDNRGPSIARNRGVKESNKKLIAFLDVDDAWMKDKVKKQAAFIEEHPGVDLVFSDYDLKSSEGVRRCYCRHIDRLQTDTLESLYLRGGPILMSTVILRRKVFEQVGGFDPDIPKGQDTDLWLRVAADHTIHHLPVSLVQKRERADSVSANMPKKVKYLRRIADRYAEIYPRLTPLREKKHAILSELLARYWLRQNKRTYAFQEAIESIRRYPTSLRAYVLMLLSTIPISGEFATYILNTLSIAANKMKNLYK